MEKGGNPFAGFSTFFAVLSVESICDVRYNVIVKSYFSEWKP